MRPVVNAGTLSIPSFLSSLLLDATPPTPSLDKEGEIPPFGSTPPIYLKVRLGGVQPLVPFLSAIASGLLLAASFPRWDFNLLAWVALVPLLLVLNGQPTRRRFFLGWLTGLAFFSCTLWWVTVSMRLYGGLPAVAAFAFLLLLAAYLALYIGLFAVGVGPTVVSSSPIGILAPALLWTALEYARAHLLTGFPWASLAYSQYRNLPIIQIADVASIYGVGFLIVLVNTAAASLLCDRWRGQRVNWKPLGIAACAVVATLGYGHIRLTQTMGDGAISVAVVQGNIAQDKKWDEDFRDETLDRYLRLSRSVMPARPALVVWPESATPVFFQTDPTYQTALFDLVATGQFDLLFGSPAFDQEKSAGPATLYNSAFLLSSTRSDIDRYDKRHLVPFGEYIPLGPLLFFVNKMAEGIGDFASGQTPTVLKAAGTQIGVVICFEVIFPEEVREFAHRGASLMTTLTNDAWFGDSAAAEQHFSMVVFRAIENRVPFARAANTGISGFIDAHGNIQSRTALFVEAAAVASLSPGTRRTFYTTHGDRFALACVFLAVGGAVGRFFKRRRSQPQG